MELQNGVTRTARNKSTSETTAAMKSLKITLESWDTVPFATCTSGEKWAKWRQYISFLSWVWQVTAHWTDGTMQIYSSLWKSIGEGNGTPLQYSCLENPMDGGAWWAAVHGVAKSRTRLKRLSSSSISGSQYRSHWAKIKVSLGLHSFLEVWGENMSPCSFQLLEAAYIPGLMAASSISKGKNATALCAFRLKAVALCLCHF